MTHALDQKLLKRLNQTLAAAPHAHILELLRIHCEDERHSDPRTLVLTNTLEVRAEKVPAGEDWRIREIRLAPGAGRLPAYLVNAIEEIVAVVESKRELVARISLVTDTVFSGRLDLAGSRIAVNDGALTAEVLVDGYDEQVDWSPRTKHKIRFLNMTVARTRVEVVARLFMLYSDEFLSLGDGCSTRMGKDFALSSEGEPLLRVRAVHGNATRYYYDGEQLMPGRTLMEVTSLLSGLSDDALVRLQRCLRWVRLFQAQTASDYLLFSAIAIESLIENPVLKVCHECGSKKFQDGATQAYRNLLRAYWKDGDPWVEKLPSKLYAARSRIAHGGQLSALDDPATPFKRCFSRSDDFTDFPVPGVLVLSMLRSVILHWLRDHGEDRSLKSSLDAPPN